MNENTKSGAGVPSLKPINPAEEIAALKAEIIKLKAKIEILESPAKPSFHGSKPQWKPKQQDGI
jgi:hypothetical protein